MVAIVGSGLFRLAAAAAGVLGARMTGGGFGGSIVALARSDAPADTADRIASAYSQRGLRATRVLVGGA